MKSVVRCQFLFLALFMQFDLSAVAQVEADSADVAYRSQCQSQWTEYGTPKENNSIVRSNGDYRVVYIEEKVVSGPHRHIFIVKQNESSSETAFSTCFYHQCNPGVLAPSVVISDMRLYGGTCYFCGKMTHPTELEYYGGEVVNKTYGFVGWFSIPSVLGGTWSVYYKDFGETTQLTRLAISKPDASTLLVSAIGFQRPDRYPCIVEMIKSNNAWNWRYEYVYNGYNMVFSDIMTMRDSITLLAQYSCANDNLPGTPSYDNNHQVFLLDRYDLGGCYNMNSSICTSAVARYFMSPSEYHYFHYDRTPMRLTHIKDEYNMFGVAFGVEEADGSNGGIRLFAFQNAWQCYSSLYYQTGSHAEIKDVGNKYNSDNLYVLSKDNTHTNGLTAVLSLSSTLHNVTWLLDNNYTYNSLTQKFAGYDIDISGHNGSWDFYLFDQNIYLLSEESCFTKEVYEYEVILEHQREKHEVKWEFKNKDRFEWNTAEKVTLQITTNTVCVETCN